MPPGGSGRAARCGEGTGTRTGSDPLWGEPRHCQLAPEERGRRPGHTDPPPVLAQGPEAATSLARPALTARELHIFKTKPSTPAPLRPSPAHPPPPVLAQTQMLQQNPGALRALPPPQQGLPHQVLLASSGDRTCPSAATVTHLDTQCPTRSHTPSFTEFGIPRCAWDKTLTQPYSCCLKDPRSDFPQTPWPPSPATLAKCHPSRLHRPQGAPTLCSAALSGC